MTACILHRDLYVTFNRTKKGRIVWSKTITLTIPMPALLTRERYDHLRSDVAA